MHLNDEQIQDYLDGNLAAGDPAVLHLKDCAACQKAVEDYRLLYQGLAADPGFELSPNFADKVVASLPAVEVLEKEADERRKKIQDRFIAIAAVVAFVGAAIYFLKPQSLLKPVLAWFGQPSELGSGLSQNFSSYTDSLGFNPTLIIFAVLTFLIIALIDRMIAHRRSHQHEISTFA